MKNINLLYLSLKTVLLLTLFLGFKLGFSQSVLNDCTGMAASQDALANPAWRFITGTWRIQNGQGVIFSTNHGFVNNRFKINGPGSTNVTQITSEQIPLVRPGAQWSYRIGTPSGGGQYERMLTTFEVGPENTLLLIHFAVVLQTPNHPESQQPKFELQVFDQNNNLTPCGEYKFVAGHFPGFKKEGNKEFLNWTAASVDLTAFLGQKVTIQLSTFDCAAIAHWGFAHFDIECLRSQITASDFCPGVDHQITLTAPPGFTDYAWSNGETSPTINVQNPTPGQVYSVRFKPFSILTGNCDFTLEYKIPDIAQLDIQPVHGLCVGASSTVTVSGPSDISEYTWSNGAIGPTITVSQPGVYSVSATKGDCTFTASTMVEEKPLPRFQVETQNARCFGGTGSTNCISDSTNYTYLWSTGAGTPALTDLLPGTYTVTVTTQDGCTKTEAVTVAQPPEKVVTGIEDTQKCPGKATTLSPTGDFIAYEWSNGVYTAENTVVDAGTYTVTATDSVGCTVVRSVQVTDHSEPQPQIAGSNHVCPGQTTSLQPTASFSKYEWSTGATNSSIIVGAGSFTVTVTDGNGCTNTAEQAVEQKLAPPLSLSAGDALICGATDSQTITANASTGLSFSLNGGPGTVSNEFQVGSGGLYFIVVADTFGCTNTKEIEIRQSFDPQPSISGNRDFCENFETTLSAPAGFVAYLWSNGATTQHTIVDTTTLLTLTATDTLGCLWQTPPTQITEHVIKPQVEGIPPLCHGIHDGIISVNTVEGAPGSVRAQINNASPWAAPGEDTGLPPGTYYFRLTDDLGCVFDTTIYFLEPPFYFVNVLDTLVDIELGEEWRLGVETNAPSLEATWSPTVGIIDSSRTDAIVVSPVKDTWYILRAVAPGNCPLPPDKVLIRVKNTEAVYVPNTFSPNNDGENDHFMPFVKTSAVKSIRRIAVSDRWGELVFEKRNLLPDNDPEQGWDGTSRGKACATGVYLWHLDVEFTDGRLVRRSGDVTLIR